MVILAQLQEWQHVAVPLGDDDGVVPLLSTYPKRSTVFVAQLTQGLLA